MDTNNKNKSTHSRGSSVCDHCGKGMNRHNLRRHTLEFHKGLPVKERIVGVKSITNFVVSLNNSQNNNSNEFEYGPALETIYCTIFLTRREF